MRILYSAIDQQVPGTKGGSTHVRAVAEGLAARGHEVHVATTPAVGGLPASSDRLHWHAIAAPLGRAQFRLARRGALRRLAAALKPDAVIERYHNFGGEGLLAAKAIGARTLLEVNAPVIDYAGSPKHVLDRLLLVEPMRRWREWQCRAADLIVTPTADILPAWVPAARIIETEWGADTALFRPDIPPTPLPATQAGTQSGTNARPIVVMFVGAFRTWHGVHHLLRAMEQLRARARHPFHAILIGDGPERPRAEAQVRASGLDNVTLLGARPHDEIPGYLSAADIGVAPFDIGAHAPLALTFYWSPLKVFEYMAAGLPVVAPDIPRLRAVIRPDVDGLLYDAARPDALADTLERLADPDRRAAMGTAARARAVQHFSWAAHCERLDDALTRLVHGPGGGVPATRMSSP